MWHLRFEAFFYADVKRHTKCKCQWKQLINRCDSIEQCTALSLSDWSTWNSSNSTAKRGHIYLNGKNESNYLLGFITSGGFFHIRKRSSEIENRNKKTRWRLPTENEERTFGSHSLHGKNDTVRSARARFNCVDVYFCTIFQGTLEDGTVFDSSISRGQPISFTLGMDEVIKGWDQGLLGMCEGEKRKLTIPPELGYGAAGAGDAIPPNSVLIFETELIKIERRDDL